MKTPVAHILPLFIHREAFRRTIAWERAQAREADDSLRSEYAAEDTV